MCGVLQKGTPSSGAQSDTLPTPPVSPSAAPPSCTPLTAPAASTAATAEHPSLDPFQHAGAGQALLQPFALDNSVSHPAMTAPGFATLSTAPAPIPGASTVMPGVDISRPPQTASPGTGSAAGIVSSGVSVLGSPRARSSDLKLNSRSQQATSRAEASSAGTGLAPSRSASASSAIAAAARANAAAANAIAESGALANGTFPKASGQFQGSRMGDSFGSAVRTFTVPANNPPAQCASGPVAPAGSHEHLTGSHANGYAGAASNGPPLSGVFSNSRSGPLAAGQVNAVSASQAASMSMSQQQRLSGTAFMTAMQQATPANPIPGTCNGTAASSSQTAAGFPNNSHNVGLGQQPAANLAFGPGQNPQPFLNPNFRLPSGPAPFKSSSNPSLRGASLPGSSINPSFVPSSSALNPVPSGNPAALGSQPQGYPLSSNYKPQGLRAAALESANQAISPAASQVKALHPSIHPFLHSLTHSIVHTQSCSLNRAHSIVFTQLCSLMPSSQTLIT